MYNSCQTEMKAIKSRKHDFFNISDKRGTYRFFKLCYHSILVIVVPSNDVNHLTSVFVVMCLLEFFMHKAQAKHTSFEAWFLVT